MQIKIKKENKAIILISAHYGNMEMLSCYLNKFVTPIHQVARESNFKEIDDFIIKAGVRRENIDLVVNDYSTLKLCKTPDVCSVPVNVVGDTLTYSATTYNVGIRYNWQAYFQPFANYSQGSDISDIGRLLRTATVNDIADIQTQASIIDNYEIGFTSVVNNNFRLEFSAYRSTSELGTTNSYDAATGIYMPVRAPQEIYGYEALVNYSFSHNLDVTASYAWVEGKDTLTDYTSKSKDSIAIPLNSLTSETIYNLKINNENGAEIDNQYSTFTIKYTTEEEYVSRSCGYRIIFNDVTFSNDDTNWIKGVTPETLTTIENQDAAHVQIFH